MFDLEKAHQRYRDELARKAALHCPHCGVSGQVDTWNVKLKQGISGGKATGALLTGGLSILATGLSRKQSATCCYCRNCGMKWHVA